MRLKHCSANLCIKNSRAALGMVVASMWTLQSASELPAPWSMDIGMVGHGNSTTCKWSTLK